MFPNHQNNHAAASPSGLENHLRNLILSSNSVEPGSSPRSPPAARHSLPPGFSSPTSGGNHAQPVDSTPAVGDNEESPFKGTSQASRGRRKRPNQAQRRQMNSQLSIPIDPHPPQQATPPRTYSSPNSHYSRPSQGYQRHMYSNSVPRALSHESRSNHLHGPNPWNDLANNHGPLPPGFPPYASHAPHYEQRRGGPGQLYNPRRPPQLRQEEIASQAALLDHLCFHVVSNSEIERSEIAEKEAFRRRIEEITRETIFRFEKENDPSLAFDPFSVELKCFGSLSSGFATKASDMDLGLLSPMSPVAPDAVGSQIPRLLEKAFLNAGLGARLLTRTRVPIIKLCESPPGKLYQDLLDERYKWENGIDNEHHDDDEHEANFMSNDHDEDQAQVASIEHGSPSTQFTIPGHAAGETQSFQLKQGPKNSLSSYYGLAKRTLRRASGRDVTISSYRDFTDQDWDILDRVCQAFVAGLADPELRKRLAKYPSLVSKDVPNKKSLLGVFTLIEGEQIIQLWENKGNVEESNATQKFHTEQSIKTWNEVVNTGKFGEDPVFHSKQLQVALERVRKAPSVQFVTLEQGQHETPVQYYDRAHGIIVSVTKAEDLTDSKLHNAVTMRYIAGMYQEDIRNAVQEYISPWATNGHIPSLAALRRHESLHLAWELERALERNLYETSHIADIKKYIELLRSPIEETIDPDFNKLFRISLNPETSDLVDRIRALQDPHRMPPNQPRDRYRDRLEFPKTGTGVQCDINFSAHLALQNTLLLRCYSHTDVRVRPMILFIKHWAKVRGINSGYRGTLSSYGYVLMVLHYLVNIAQPFVSPNLQQLAPLPPINVPPAELQGTLFCRGHNVQFWRNEDEIMQLAQANQLNHNSESIGHLLRGFFEYYAQSGMMSSSQNKGFDWGRDVLSLRTPGGLLTKQLKGWTGAKTVYEPQAFGATPPPDQATSSPSGLPPANHAERGMAPKQCTPVNKTVEVKEVRHRYLFAIEDPFELDHNVARTVTHNGIVSIRDEFRRAWRIVKSAVNGTPGEDLLQDVNNVEEIANPFLQLLDSIHGTRSPVGS